SFGIRYLKIGVHERIKIEGEEEEVEADKKEVKDGEKGRREETFLVGGGSRNGKISERKVSNGKGEQLKENFTEGEKL
ncbi:hypothetical protein RUM43_009737, partial [Polyplax serrata]